MKKGLFAILMSAYLGVIGYIVADHFYIQHIPDLKVGDCAVYMTEGNEFEAPRALEAIKIVAIGKEYYQYLTSYSRNDKDFSTSPISYIDDRYTPVSCTGAK